MNKLVGIEIPDNLTRCEESESPDQDCIDCPGYKWPAQIDYETNEEWMWC